MILHSEHKMRRAAGFDLAGTDLRPRRFAPRSSHDTGSSSVSAACAGVIPSAGTGLRKDESPRSYPSPPAPRLCRHRSSRRLTLRSVIACNSAPTSCLPDPAPASRLSDRPSTSAHQVGPTHFSGARTLLPFEKSPRYVPRLVHTRSSANSWTGAHRTRSSGGGARLSR